MSPSRERAWRSITLALAPALCATWSGCGAPKPKNQLCRTAPGSREVIVVEVDRDEVQVPPPCPRNGQAFIDSPVSLRATSEGLRVRFSVRDVSFVPGALRDPRCDRYAQGEHPQRCQRDAVALFPAGSLPGASYVELELIPRPEGYRVDQVFPWSTWGLDRGLGRFRLTLVVFERGPGGEENQLRFVSILHVLDRRPRPSRDEDAGGTT